MNVYKFSEENIKQAMRSLLKSKAPILICTGLFALFYTNIKNPAQGVEGSSLIALIVFVIIVMFVFYLKKQELAKTSFRVSSTNIQKTVGPQVKSKIEFTDVKSHKFIKRGLLLKSPRQQFLIPIELNEFKELSKLIVERINLN